MQQSRSLLSLFLIIYQKRSLKSLIRGQTERDQLQSKIIEHFWRQWFKHAANLLQMRWSTHLHIAAICMVSSALVSSYISGLTTSYQASAASTFLSTDQVINIAHLFLWPAWLCFGSLTKVATAAPWINYYAFTLILYVLLPRMIALAYTLIKTSSYQNYFTLPLQSLSSIPTLNVALSSHTNVGKTSLARTLLRRDVGEVKDAKNVTQTRAGYFLIHTEEVRLRLWDTPGFTDAASLAKHLTQKKDWGWLKNLRSESLRFDREAALSLKDEADIILYIVPDQCNPSTKAQVSDEWNILNLLHRPVIVVLNRVSTYTPEKIQEILSQWKTVLSSFTNFTEILVFDAFYRTTEDEALLFDAMIRHVAYQQRSLAQQCKTVWVQQQQEQQQNIVACLSELIIFLSFDQMKAKDSQAEEHLQDRAQNVIQQTQQKVLNLIGLDHQLQSSLLQNIEEALQSIVPRQGERTWGAVIGGAVSGLASGIMTDFLAGGLTFFGGAAVGLVLGALGGAGLAEGYSRINGQHGKILLWDEDFIQGVTLRILFIYLSASTFGRARGVFNDQQLTLLNESTTEIDQRQLYTLHVATKVLETHWDDIWSIIKSNRDIHDDSIWLWSRKKVTLNLDDTSQHQSQLKIAEICQNIIQDGIDKWSLQLQVSTVKES